MDSVKNDMYYLQKILNDIKFLIKHTKNMNRNDIEKDEVLLDSIMFRFIQMSEQIKKLTIEFKTMHSDIPWKNIIGLRNRIVHDYGNIDIDIIYHAVKFDIYDIHDVLEIIEKSSD